ncbi:HTH luxR-type domain-containing protein [Bordetella sputigena]|uniref:helix-turn-helix transcriptional regulator n=1 Tax=Bordetella sputigena TaxID=1416810 RepID=UPI0039F05CCE
MPNVSLASSDSCLPWDTIARLIGEAGSRASLDVLFDALAGVVPFEMVSVLVYRGRGRPVLLYDNFGEPAHRQGLDNYLRLSYVLNPCYQAYLGGLRGGVMRIRDLLSGGAALPADASRGGQAHRGGAVVNDGSGAGSGGGAVPVAISDDEEIGYVTLGWPLNRAEVLALVPLPGDAAAEIGLLRPRAAGGFSDAHLQHLRALHPIMAAVVARYWLEHGNAAAAASAMTPPDSRIDAVFDDFGKPRLSPREAQVMRMVLQGHSSESIGLHLDISITTVKTHRKNAYAKLGISTQSELLALFLKTARLLPGEDVAPPA